MKTTKKVILTELTAQESALINGGRHGADDLPGDDRGGRRGGGGQDDGPNHT